MKSLKQQQIQAETGLSKRLEAGFSLVELMIVVAIIGLLATIAVPKFEIFRAKARQVEAKNNLSHIYTLEHAFFGDQEEFVNMAATGFRLGSGGCENQQNDLGFYLSPCSATETSVRYSYEVTGASFTEFTGTASSGTGNNNKIVGGCATADVWTIEETKSLINDPKAIAQCNE